MAGAWPTPDPISTVNFDNDADSLTLARADLLKMIGLFNSIQASIDDGATPYTTQNPQVGVGLSVLSGYGTGFNTGSVYGIKYGSFSSASVSTVEKVVDTVMPKSGVITDFVGYIPSLQNSLDSITIVTLIVNHVAVPVGGAISWAGGASGVKNNAGISVPVNVGDLLSVKVDTSFSSTGILSHLTWSIAIS